MDQDPKVLEFKRLDIILTKNPQTQIPLLIYEWYRLHRGKGFNKKLSLEGVIFPPLFEEKNVTNQTERRANLRQYLLNVFPDNGPLIDKQIEKIADHVGYDEDSFYLGGRRKRRATRIVKPVKKSATRRRLVKHARRKSKTRRRPAKRKSTTRRRT